MDGPPRRFIDALFKLWRSGFKIREELGKMYLKNRLELGLPMGMCLQEFVFFHVCYPWTIERRTSQLLFCMKRTNVNELSR